MPWYEAEVEKKVRSLLAERRELVGVDLAATPPRILFRTSAARTRLYDKYATTSKGQARQEKGAGKKGKSGGVALPGGPQVWMAFIETRTDEDKKALFRAVTNITKEIDGTGTQGGSWRRSSGATARPWRW